PVSQRVACRPGGGGATPVSTALVLPHTRTPSIPSRTPRHCRGHQPLPSQHCCPSKIRRVLFRTGGEFVRGGHRVQSPMLRCPSEVLSMAEDRLDSITRVGKPVVARKKGDFSSRPSTEVVGVSEDEVRVRDGENLYLLERIKTTAGVVYRPLYFTIESRLRPG